MSPNNPKHIQSFVLEKQRNLRKLELKIEEVLPELVAMYQQSPLKPKIKYFEGVDGLRQINFDTINPLSELPEDQRNIYSYSNPNLLHLTFEDYIYEKNGYLDLRKKFSIHNKVIALDGKVTRDIATRNEEELREMVILPEEIFPFKNDITIYSNKIAIESIRSEKIGVIIESSEIVQDQMAIFNLAWNSAKSFYENSKVR